MFLFYWQYNRILLKTCISLKVKHLLKNKLRKTVIQNAYFCISPELVSGPNQDDMHLTSGASVYKKQV